MFKSQHTYIEYYHNEQKMVIKNPSSEFYKFWKKYILLTIIRNSLLAYLVCHILITFIKSNYNPFSIILYIVLIFSLRSQTIIFKNNHIITNFVEFDGYCSKKYYKFTNKLQNNDIEYWTIYMLNDQYVLSIKYTNGLNILFSLFGDREYINHIKTEISKWLPLEKELDICN